MTLQIYCQSQAAAGVVSATAGKVATSAIQAVFGPDPCRLFQGDCSACPPAQMPCIANASDIDA